MRLGPGANQLEGGFQNGACQCLCLQGELQLLAASLADSPRSTDESDLGSFQITASALVPGVCEILCAPFKRGISISPSPLGLLKLIPAGLQSQTFWGLGACLPGAGSLGWGAQYGAQTPRSLRSTSAVVIILTCVGHPLLGCGSRLCAALPLLPILLWFLL